MKIKEIEGQEKFALFVQKKVISNRIVISICDSNKKQIQEAQRHR